VTTAPADPTYTGEELAAYNTLNTARTTCGFGYLQQNTKLDTAVAGHVNWLIKNNTYGHFETTGTAGFTGANPAARISASGYVADGNSIATGESSYANMTLPALTPANGTFGTKALLAAPYHLQEMMFAFREVGISVKTGGPTGSGADVTGDGLFYSYHVAMDSGMSKTNGMLPQIQGATEVLTYPCEGVTNSAFELRNEAPNPVPGRDLSTNPVGQPIYVQSRDGIALVITSASVTGPSGSVALLPTLTKASDQVSNPAGVWYGTGNQAIILPDSPLSPNSNYSVVINGTILGAPFTKRFTFKTGI
jgi:hypothetical protein